MTFKKGQQIWILAAKNGEIVTRKERILKVDKQGQKIEFELNFLNLKLGFEQFGTVFFDSKVKAQIQIEKLMDKLSNQYIFLLDSSGEVTKYTISGFKNMTNANNGLNYDVGIFLPEIGRYVSIMEIGKKLFFYKFNKNEPIYIIETIKNMLIVCEAWVVKQKEENKKITVLTDYGEYRVYDYNKINTLFFKRKEDAERAISKLPKGKNDYLYKKINGNIFRVRVTEIKWIKKKGRNDIWLYLEDGTKYPLSQIGDSVFR